MEKNKITVFVAGHKLTLLSEDSEKYVTDIASKVDTAINSLFANTNMSKEKCAVLTALDLCDDEAKARQQLNEVKEQIKEYIEDSAKLRDENAKLKEKIEKLESEKLQLLTSKKTMIATSVEIKDEKVNKCDEAQISADDDLSFDDVTNESVVDVEVTAEPTTEKKPQTPAVSSAQKNDKKRHNHEHVNPFKERFMQKKAGDKGYTPVRQYSLFDDKKDE